MGPGCNVGIYMVFIRAPGDGEAASPWTSVWTLLGLSTCLSFQAQALPTGHCELKNHMVSISQGSDDFDLSSHSFRII